VEHICLEHGIGTGTLRDRMRRWKWTRRRQPISPEGPPSAPPCEPALSLSTLPESGATAPSPSVVLPTSSAPADPEQIARQLQAAIAHVLPAIETTLGKLGSSAPREMKARRVRSPR
jgi:hypothetical protein